MDFAMLHHYAIFFLIFLLIPLINLNLVSSQLISSPDVTIPLGSSLTATNAGNINSSSWTSSSGDFAFGFIQPGTGGGGYLLAIWFNKLPEKTVIWSANRNTLAPEGSRLQLQEDGRFVLNDPTTGHNIWNADTRGGEVAYGVMLDTGNFVLASNTSSTLWQSFDTPTDTLLPTQMLTQGRYIVSSLSVTNYSSGKFELSMQTDGDLVLYTTQYPLTSGADMNSAYWATETSGDGFQFFFNQSGFISLIAPNKTLINPGFTNPGSSSVDSFNQYYQRLTLDYDGVLRQYVYPKSSTDGRPMAWSILQFLPSNICLSIMQTTGGGVCGFNSMCSWGSNGKKVVCKCPDGYSFIDPNDSMSGCKPDFVPQSCNNKENETGLFGYNEMLKCDWPFSSDFELFSPVTEDWCKQACLSDCFCAVAVFYDTSKCVKKHLPLFNGRTDLTYSGKVLFKVRLGNSTLISPPDHTSSSNLKGNSKTWKVNKVIIILGSVLLGISLLLLAKLFFGNKKAYTRIGVASNPVIPGLNIRSFSYRELEEATNGFTEELGSGACSIVYKGTLRDDGMQLVAVKKLRNMVVEGEQEFNAEVRSISRTNHKNLVQLIGYCNEGQHRLLVYEYMRYGSLASFIFNNPRPNWHHRVRIASTTARALYYLHEECSSQIIHCGIKPQNVLLDEFLTAKISDFGLAKLLKQDQTKTTTVIRGTRGYVAPEWYRNMAITSKVDVYSFGILLLELVCCRKNIETTNVRDEKEVILSDWAYDCYNEEKLQLLIADDTEALNDLKMVEKFVSIAIWCIQEEPSLRPSMKRVVQMLEGSISVSLPPNPSSFISSISN